MTGRRLRVRNIHMNIDSCARGSYGRCIVSYDTDPTPPAGPAFLDSYLPYLLRRADQTLSAPFYARLDHAGIARSDWRVLAVLHRAGAMGVVELAAAALSPQPTVTHAVRRLESRNLVRRERGAHDKRQRIIALTPGGAELVGGLIDEATRLQDEALAGTDHVDELVRMLGDLMASVGTGTTDRTPEASDAE